MMLAKSTFFQVIYQVVLLLTFATRSPILSALFVLVNVVLIANSFKVFLSLTPVVGGIILTFILVTGVMFAVNAYRYLPAIVFWALGIFTVLGMAALLSFKDVVMKASGITLYSFQLISLLFCAYYGFDNFPWENPLEKVIPGASANGITSYIVILQLNYSAMRYVSDKKPPYLAIIFTILIAVAGYGRGSIVSGVLILFLSLFIQLFSDKALKVGILIVVLITGIVVFYFTYQTEIDFFILSKTKFAAAGVKSSHREFMVADYLGKMNWYNSIFGAGYEDTAITTYYHNNPHNSFIRAHSIFGLPYLLIIFITPLVAMAFYNSILNTLFVGFCFLVLSLRCYTEPNLFPSIMDFYYFSLILFPIQISRFDKKQSITA